MKKNLTPPVEPSDSVDHRNFSGAKCGGSGRHPQIADLLDAGPLILLLLGSRCLLCVPPPGRLLEERVAWGALGECRRPHHPIPSVAAIFSHIPHWVP